jgi:hypothetical protein
MGEAGGLNLYGYVANNPIFRTDPLGLFLGTSLNAGEWLGAVVTGAGEGFQGNVIDPLGTAAGLAVYNNVAGDVKLGFGAGLGGYIDVSQNGNGGYGIDAGFGNAFGGTFSATVSKDIVQGGSSCPTSSSAGGEFGYNVSAEGRVGPFGAGAGLTGTAAFYGNGDYQINPLTGNGSIGLLGGQNGPQINGNLFNASAVSGSLLNPQVSVSAGTGVFFFAGAHAGFNF